MTESTRAEPSQSWTWHCHDAAGQLLDLRENCSEATQPFANQSDAENWLGLNWRELLAAGAETAQLYHDGRPSYDPMSLRPAQ